MKANDAREGMLVEINDGPATGVIDVVCGEIGDALVDTGGSSYWIELWRLEPAPAPRSPGQTVRIPVETNAELVWGPK